MTVILLCAGFGTRMYPLTRRCPKPLLPVAGRPALDYLMEQLVRLWRLKTIHLVTNDRFFEHFAAWRQNWEPVLQQHEIALRLHNDGCRENEHRLGAVADLAFVLRALGTPRAALVVAGDNIFRFSLQPIWETFSEAGRNILVALPEGDRKKRQRAAVPEIGPDDRILRLHEKPARPPSSWICPPIYFLQPSALRRVDEYLARPEAQDAPGYFIAHLVAREPVYAFHIRGSRFDIGSMASYEEANTILQREPVIEV